MIKVWADHAWDDYLYWQGQDRKTLKRINQLLKDIDRNGHTGLGKPEPSKHDQQGYWSRRIDDFNRLVYREWKVAALKSRSAARIMTIS